MDHGLRHLDYFPLINSRAHKLGSEQTTGILNKQFKATYDNFLQVMVEKKELNNSDWIVFSYYLLLQDRVTEAMNVF